MRSIILHIDFDSFFASVEQQYHPEYRGKPLGVTARNGRNCIIAASREAKRLGIGTGSRRHDALKLCPTMSFVQADFNKYWEISQKFLAICKDFSPFVEVFSIDELFMDVTMTAHLFGGVHALIQKVKDRIRDEIGEYITVSVGISYNKLLAKLGSGLKKPDGIVEIKPSQVPYIYRIATLQDICGIGRRIEKRLNQMGIYTLTQLSATPLHSLIAEFGDVEGHFLYNAGRGKDTSVVKPFSVIDEAKSISRNYCLPQNEYNDRIVLQNLYELCEELGIKLRRLNKKARHVGFVLRGQGNVMIQRTFHHYSDDGKDIFDLLMLLIQQTSYVPDEANMTHELSWPAMETNIPLGNSAWKHLFSELGYVRQISVWVSYLLDKDQITQHMFFDNPKREQVVHMVDIINEKYGDHTIRNGFLLYADKLTTVPNGYMADRYERMKLAQYNWGDE
jgi:DNA polymerase IV